MSDTDRHREVERPDPSTCGGEFARPRAHRQVAGDEHRGGRLAPHAVGHPGERRRVFQPEVQVADVEERGHAVERNATLLTSPQNFARRRSEEHTSELQSLMRISYAVFCLKKKKTQLKS